MVQGYGTIITTGGVGAEDKDFSVEAVLRLDPDAVTPYITKFTKGEGRHKKDGVRIAVGQAEGTTMVSLPGPNDEVKACLDALARGLKNDVGKEALAADLASILRERLREKMGQGHFHHTKLQGRK
jgi:molybdopterin biosynthesis enzyme MoaB